MFRRVWHFLSTFHRTFVLFAGLMTIYSLFEVLGSYMPSLVVQLHDNQADPLTWALVILGKYVFDDIYARLDNAVDWHIVVKHCLSISRFLRTAVLGKLLDMDIGWHQRMQSGVLFSRLSYGVEKMDDLVSNLSWEFVPRTIQALISFIPLSILSPLSAALAAIAAGIFLKLTVSSNRARKSIRSARFDLYDQMGHREVEVIQNISTVSEYRQGSRLLAEYRDLHDKQMVLAEKDFWISNYHYNRLRIWVINVTKLVIVPIWVLQLKFGWLTVPQLIFIWSLTDKLFESCWRYAGLLDRVFDSSEPIGRVVSLQDEIPTVLHEGIVKEASGPLSIVMKDVCFSYKGDYDADDGTIHDLAFNLPQGSTLAVVGTSGAGKSTLYQLIMGMRYPQSGDVFVGGVNVRDWDHQALLAQISHMASGDLISIFDETIRQNIAFGKSESSLSEVRMAAEMAGLAEFVESLPSGYETRVGEKGIRLSAGQKQRMAFARALVMEAQIMLLDEPTSAVDAGTEMVMQQAIRKLHRRCTMMISAHRLATTMHADNIIVLEGGRKVEEGTHEQLLSVKGRYARMWAMQTGKEEF